ncbi:MAG: amino acid adenylation domain-containing protein [Candidatus Latescibacteria bacterium]|nr:amino acid adenylation domain-containing protein [Candidatus Latescibacterota bacterium]
MTIYYTIKDGSLSSLPLVKPELQYRDFAAWQNARLTTDELEKQRHYWLEHLKGVLPRLELPLDAPRPSRRDYLGATLSYRFPEELLIKLRDFTSKYDYTIFPILLSGLRILLFRYTGQSEIILNSPLTLRGRPELEKLPGDFTNTVLFRGSVNYDSSFKKLTDEAAEEVDVAMANREYPFDLLATELDVRNDLSRAPFSDVGITLVEDYSDVQHDQGLRFESFDIEVGISKYDMVFHFSLSSDGLSLEIEYDSAIFHESRIRRMVSNLNTLLNHGLSQPDTVIYSLDILDPAEKSMIERFQRPRPRNYDDTTIHGEFERVASEQPDSCALVLDDGSLMSFAELDQKANRIAAMLFTNGYTIGDRIAVHMHRGPDIPLLILGILKAGCVYVPIADDSPPPRIRFMLKDCKAKAVITTDELTENIHDALPCLNITDVKNYQATASLPNVSHDSEAYIIYTSGSTGNPKGVLLPHIGLVNRARDLKERVSLSSKDRFTQFASLSFDASLYEIFCALLSGASLVVADRETIENTDKYFELLEQKKVTFTLLPPAYLRRLGRVKLKGIRVLFTAGEAADVGDALHYGHELTYVNGYGPTEDSVCTSAYIVDPTKEYPFGIPIGDPVGDTEAMVLDRNLNQAPVGVPGQLCVSDSGLARGYLNLPELTSEMFVPHPFKPEKRMYMTGDIARWEEDGNLLFFGRADNQVKIGGHRIELGEIESVMRRIEGVGNVCVVTVGEAEDSRLAAYYTGLADKKDMRVSLLEILPRYMVPHFFTKMDSLPLTSSGKIDRKALPEPVVSKESGSREALSDEEITLTSVIRDVLGNQTLSVEENFFSAGGDSIRAIQTVSRLRENGWSLTAADFFETPVIADLARAMKPLRQNMPQEPVSGAVKPAPILEWFKQTVITNPEHFNQAVMLKSEAEIDFSSIQLALSAIWKHHDALRLISDDGTFSVLPDNTLFEVRLIDLRENPDQDIAMLEAVEQVHTNFNLKTGPLFRAVMFMHKDGVRLLLVAHHLVVDAFSWGIIVRDLESAYLMARDKKPVHLPSKTHSYIHWAETIHNKLKSGDFDGELPYWQSVVNTECDILGSDAEEGIMVTIIGKLTGRDVTDILDEGISFEPMARMIAGLGCALKEWKNCNRIRLLLEGHGRNIEDSGIDITRTVGWFTTIWPFNLECESDIQAAFKNIHTKLANVPNGGLGYGVLRYLGGHAELETTMDISFNYLGRLEGEEGKFSMVNENLGLTVSPENRLGQILEFVLFAIGDTLEINLTYDSGCLTDSEAKLLLELFREWLKRTKGCRIMKFDYDDFGDGGVDSFLENI